MKKMQQLNVICIAKWVLAVLMIHLYTCCGQPTHVTRHACHNDDSTKMTTLDMVGRALNDAAVASASATQEIATNVNRQASVATVTQSEVLKLVRTVNGLLTELQSISNSSNFSASAAKSVVSLQQTVQTLTKSNMNISAQIEELFGMLIMGFRDADAKVRVSENNLISSLTAQLWRSFELLNETMHHSYMNLILSQSNESLVFLQSFPELLQSSMNTAYNNATLTYLDLVLRTLNAYRGVFNESLRGSAELAMNHTRAVANILIVATNISDSGIYLQEKMLNISLQNEQILKNTDQIFYLLDNVSIAIQDLNSFTKTNISSSKSHDILEYANEEAIRIAALNSTYLSAQSRRRVAEMQAFAESLTTAAARIMQASHIYTDRAEKCGENLYALQKPQYIRSPGYPLSYPKEINCLWTLQTKSGNGSILLQFRNFSTEECCDHLIIYDNNGFERKLSGFRPPFEVTIGYRATISFLSDRLNEDSGFEIRFTALNSGVPAFYDISRDNNGPCGQYTVLNDPWRNVQTGTGTNCDRTLLRANTWYRFILPAGNRIPDRVQPPNRCGTHAPMWLNGGHPTSESQGIVPRTLCASWGGNSCNWYTDVRVLLCFGGYYVYMAPVSTAPNCALAWCAE